MFISAQKELVVDQIETKESYTLRVEREPLAYIENNRFMVNLREIRKIVRIKIYPGGG